MTAQKIINTVCEYYNVRIETLISSYRGYADARTIMIKLLHENFPNYSYMDICRIISRNNHATIIYHLNRFENFYDSEERFRNNYNAIKTKLNGYTELERFIWIFEQSGLSLLEFCKKYLNGNITD